MIKNLFTEEEINYLKITFGVISNYISPIVHQVLEEIANDKLSKRVDNRLAKSIISKIGSRK